MVKRYFLLDLRGHHISTLQVMFIEISLILMHTNGRKVNEGVMRIDMMEEEKLYMIYSFYTKCTCGPGTSFSMS
jgi:hypothetical protein